MRIGSESKKMVIHDYGHTRGMTKQRLSIEFSAWFSLAHSWFFLIQVYPGSEQAQDDPLPVKIWPGKQTCGPGHSGELHVPVSPLLVFPRFALSSFESGPVLVTTFDG